MLVGMALIHSSDERGGKARRWMTKFGSLPNHFLKNDFGDGDFPFGYQIAFATGWFRILFGLATNHGQNANFSD